MSGDLTTYEPKDKQALGTISIAKALCTSTLDSATNSEMNAARAYLDKVQEELCAKKSFTLSVVVMFPETTTKQELSQFISLLPEYEKELYEVVLCKNIQSDRIGSHVVKREKNIVFVDNHFTQFEFDSARNEAKRFASGEWILSLDLDEYLATPIRAVLGVISQIDESINAVICTVMSHIRDNRKKHGYERICGEAIRLFRNRPQIVWMSRCHELVDFSINADTIVSSTITILHTGYDVEVNEIEQKLDRNLELLARELADPRNAETKAHAKALLVHTGHSYTINILERG